METSKAVYQMIEGELMRLLFAEATDLVYVYDTLGNILFVNKLFEQVTGGNQGELYGRPFDSLFGNDHQELARSVIAKTLGGENQQCEMCFRHSESLYEHKSFPLRDDKRTIIGVMGIARDVTARAQREDGLVMLHVSLEKCMIEHSARVRDVNQELVEEIDCRKRMEREFQRCVGKLQKSIKGIVQTMAMAIELNDVHAAGHQTRVAQLACRIAGEMGLPKDKVEGIGLAAVLHDIGKVSVPARILSKTEPLTKREFGMLMVHARTGYDLLQDIEFPYPVAPIILQHHERINGSGYPLNLPGRDILLESKILAVSDVVEAMSSPRPYRQHAGLEGALDEISRNRGVLYDFNVVHACLSVFHEQGFKFEQEPPAHAKLLEDVFAKV